MNLKDNIKLHLKRVPDRIQLPPLTNIKQLNVLLTALTSPCTGLLCKVDFTRNLTDIKNAAQNLNVDFQTKEGKIYQSNYEKAIRKQQTAPNKSSKETVLASLKITKIRLQDPVKEEALNIFIKLADKASEEDIKATDDFLRGEITRNEYLKLANSAAGHGLPQRQACGGAMILIGMVSLALLIIFGSTTLPGITLFFIGVLIGIVIVAGGILLDVSQEQPDSVAQTMHSIGRSSIFNQERTTSSSKGMETPLQELKI